MAEKTKVVNTSRPVNGSRGGRRISVVNSANKPCPASDLERRLTQLRGEIVESGASLLDWDGVAREVAERRGESA